MLLSKKLRLDGTPLWTRVLEQQSAICATLIDQKRLDLMPQDNEFKILEEITKVITPFRSITSQISGEEYVTVSALNPLFHYLVSTLKDPSGDAIDMESTKQVTVASTRAGTSSSVADVIKKAQNAILNDLSSRYQNSLVVMLLCSASFMDPRFKSLPFISTDFRVEAHENIKQLAITLVRNSKGSAESGGKNSDRTPSKNDTPRTHGVSFWDRCSIKKLKVEMAMLHL